MNDLVDRCELAELISSGTPAAPELIVAAKVFLQARADKEAAQRAEKAAGVKLEQAKAALIAKMQAASVDSVGIDDGPLISCYPKTQFHLPSKSEEERRKQAFEWLAANGLGDCIENSINHQTLGAVLRERLEEGKDVPDLFNRFEQQNLSVRSR